MGNKEHNPNAYYYRFNQPGEAQKNGAVQMDEHKVFMERVKEVGVNMHWGTFSMKIPGRVGYQCSNYWRQMMKDQWVKDPNYWIRADGSFCFKRAKKGSVPDAIRKYSFVVLKDPSKTFEEPGYHPKRPSDSKLTKYLQDNVRDIVNKKKGGKSKAKKARTTKNSGGDGRDNNKEKRVRTKSNGKKPKDPNKPKGAMTSYMLFTNEVRDKFRAENPGKRITEISKLIGAEWRSLSDEEKKKYAEKSKKLKAEYNEKMIEYKKTKEYKEYEEILRKKLKRLRLGIRMRVIKRMKIRKRIRAKHEVKNESMRQREMIHRIWNHRRKKERFRQKNQKRKNPKKRSQKKQRRKRLRKRVVH